MSNDQGEDKRCLRCGSCCTTHPCALAPGDLTRIARFLGIGRCKVFKEYLVLDYVLRSGKKRYYVCPARVGGGAGTIVPCTWTFADSPCVFLSDSGCAIEQVNPRGGRMFVCRFMTSSKQDHIGYGKKTAAKDWSRSGMLNQLLSSVENKTSYYS